MDADGDDGGRADKRTTHNWNFDNPIKGEKDGDVGEATHNGSITDSSQNEIE